MSSDPQAPGQQVEDVCENCDEPVRLVLAADFVVWMHTATGKTRCNREPGPATSRAEPSRSRAHG